MCSMISSQCDELRKTADELDERAKAYAPTGRNVLSPMLRTAADTIWELRCKLVDMVDQRDEIERLKAENAKLRELLSDTLMDPQKYCEKYDIEYEGWNSANTHLDARMRELGVVVDA